jgi:surface protein
MSIRETFQNDIRQKTLQYRARRPINAATALCSAWVRNPSWSALPAIIDTDQKFIGLHAIWPDANFLSLSAAGAYTIDWGDGVIENVATGVQAYHEYDFADADLVNTDAPVTFTDAGDLITRNNHGYTNDMEISFATIVTTTGITAGQIYYVVDATTNTFQVSATLGGSAISLTADGSGTILPYKQAIVTITPQGGSNLTALNLNLKHNQSGLQTAYCSGWLDIVLSMPNCTSSGLIISGSTLNVKHGILQRVNIVNLGGQTTMSYMFYNCSSLTSVPLFNTALVTTMSSMFYNCYSLTSVPLFNTALVTSMLAMFYNCYSLTSVPLFNTALVTTMSYMFHSCYSLTSVPLFNTALVTNMSYMFQSCYSLTSVPLFNTALVTNMSYMFHSCYSLTSVPLFNTALVTNMSYMFQSCYSLTSVPLFNTALVTTMSSMFYNCYSLTSVPLFNTALVTTMSYMFYSCYSLTSIPLFNTALVTSMLAMFHSCYSLTSVPLFNTALVTNMSYMFQSCSSLTSVPALNATSVTTGLFVTIFFGCVQLIKIAMLNINFSFSVESLKLSGARLDEIYTNLPTVTGQTITVTGNYGIATDTPSIATAKGWTVTG